MKQAFPFSTWNEMCTTTHHTTSPGIFILIFIYLFWGGGGLGESGGGGGEGGGRAVWIFQNTIVNTVQEIWNTFLQIRKMGGKTCIRNLKAISIHINTAAEVYSSLSIVE